MNTQRLIIERLRGIDQRYSTRPESASIIEEMTWDSYDGWKTAGGYDLVTQNLYDWNSSAPADGVKITSMHNYSRGSSYNEIIFENDQGQLCKLDIGKLKAGGGTPFSFLKDESNNQFDGGSGRTRFVPRANRVGTQSCTFGGRLYLVNGADEPIVYDGRRACRAGFFEKPAQLKADVVIRAYHNEWIASGKHTTEYFLGTRVKGQGLGSLKPKGVKDENTNEYIDGKICGYQYRVTFVNKRSQESEMSEASDMCTFECAAGKKRFVHIQLPIGDNSCVARRIYRTRDLLDDFGNPLGPEVGQNYYFMREIQDNETTDFEDGLPDSSLGALTDDYDFGRYPMQAKFIASFKNSIFLTGGPNNLLFYSASGMPEVFPQRNVIDLGDSDAGKITGMYASTNSLVVFKEFGVYLIKATPSGGFIYQTISRDIGCIAPNSIKDIPFTGLAFLSHKGVHAMKGFLEDSNSPTEIVNLSTPIKEIMDRLCVTASYGAVSCLNRNDKEYWLCVPTIGEKNNLLLVWHYEVGAWSIRNNYPMSCAIETRGAATSVFFGSHDITMPGIFVYTPFYRRKNEIGSTVKIINGKDGNVRKSILDYPVYETVPLKLNGLYSGVHVSYINIYAVAFGNEPIKMNFKINRNQVVALDSNKERTQQHTDMSEKLDVYGTARFDEASFGYHRPVVIRFDVSHSHKTLTTEFAIRILQDIENEFPNRIMIVGYSVDAKMGEQKNIRSMTDVLGSNRR